jgi:predicted GNAT family acetyltransferase
MAITNGLIERELTPDDINSAFALSEEAGWNQTVQDWQLMLQHGQGFGIESKKGQLVATALTLPHGNQLAWISMVLVTGSFRKQGLATQLLNSCVNSLSSQSIIPLLDATEAGIMVYRKIGFKPLYGLQRLIREENSPLPSFDQQPVAIRPMAESDLPKILDHDQVVFGGDRSAVLRHLHAQQPSCALMAEQHGTIRGYVMAREGNHAFHIGPVVAPDPEAARHLICQVLQGINGPVYIDAMDLHSDFQSWLRELGFIRQRSFTRMVLGDLPEFDQPGLIYASVGPELG